MKKLYILCVFLLLMACGKKITQNAINSGDYDQAIETATQALRTNKDKNSKKPYVFMLEEAYAKAVERDLSTLEYLKKEKNSANAEKIYQLYFNLQQRQDLIKPLLPLYLSENRTARFDFSNYTSQLVQSKKELVNYLYINAMRLSLSTKKEDARKAYDDLNFIEKLQPDFKDLASLKDKALQKGTDYVLVKIDNQTNMIIPQQLQNQLLDFSTYGLDEFWVVYHSNPQQNYKYDFTYFVNFRDIQISPEQMRDKEFAVEREIQDGVKRSYDANGNVILDDKGNAVMIPNIILAKALIQEINLQKTCSVTAKVDFVNTSNNQLIKSFPLNSTFVFQDIAAKYRGDIRAIDPNYTQYLNRRLPGFPSNAQILIDSGEELKANLKRIISNNKF
ncbi:hypothetical protein [Flavobacterium ardleyense]|uniref:hypothetical protein n=1 Tax=Flavobacterium ardleyense TaxID=2038737 RepID=UPI00298CAFFE|nr:hypothetical protein [Flavobacterium ardleyense]